MEHFKGPVYLNLWALWGHMCVCEDIWEMSAHQAGMTYFGS
jgi:hypothetical protein